MKKKQDDRPLNIHSKLDKNAGRDSHREQVIQAVQTFFRRCPGRHGSGRHRNRKSPIERASPPKPAVHEKFYYIKTHFFFLRESNANAGEI